MTLQGPHPRRRQQDRLKVAPAWILSVMLSTIPSLPIGVEERTAIDGMLVT